MNYYDVRGYFVEHIKNLLGVTNFTVYSRRRWHSFEKLIFRKKYTADDIIDCLKKAGVPSGRPLVVHSAMGAFYNYKGTANELIDKLLEFIGTEGTLCMPAYPNDKFNTGIVFDVRSSKSAAGYLSEIFRKYPNVRRSLNQLHSVCALGRDAEYITSEHHLSDICFDEHSPYQKIEKLGGFTVNLGMPKWYVGTAEHICEAKLYGKVPYFTEKFRIEKEYTYLDYDGNVFKHKMHSSSDLQYLRQKSPRIIDKYFDKSKYTRIKLSNIWITVFDIQYLSEKLSDLAQKGITIYKTPKFFY